jgi:hypothetical protein
MVMHLLKKHIIILIIAYFHALIPSCINGQQVRQWTGTGDWSVTSNWNPLGSTRNARLVWSGFGDIVSNNNTLTNIDSVRRLTFTGNTSYTLTGNTIRLVDRASGTQAMIRNESLVKQSINAPVFFDDENRLGLIGTFNEGPLFLSNVEVGNKLTVLRVVGDFTSGIINFSGSLSSTKQITIGFDENNQLKPNSRVVFAGDNSNFSGPLVVQSGILSLEHSNAAGASVTNGIEVASGAAIHIKGNITLSGKNFNIQGSGNANSGVISNLQGTNTIQSDIYLGRNCRIDALDNSSLNLGKIIRAGNAKWNLILNCSGVNANISLKGSVGVANNDSLGELLKSGIGTVMLDAPVRVSRINVNSGNFQLSGDNFIASNTELFLNGGNFKTGTSIGYNQLMGVLGLGSGNGSTISLGEGSHALIFSNSRNEVWNATRRITIKGWSGSLGQSGTSGRIFVEPADEFTPGLTAQQLNQITFEGPWNCGGAMLLASGELVPANIPFISSIGGNPPGGSGSAFKGYVGSTITISGCLFSGVNELQIGGTSLFPPAFIVNASGTSITFSLPDNVSGLVSLIIPAGTRTHPTPLVNLGYITNSSPVTDQHWLSGTSPWRGLAGGEQPPENRSVLVAHRQISVINNINIFNTSPANVHQLTIAAPSSGFNPALRLGVSDAIPNHPPLVLGSRAVLRTYNGSSNVNNDNLPGFNADFGTLQLVSNASIALGAGQHTLRFDASDTINWTPNTFLTICNWKGTLDEEGNEGRIYFGNSSNALTEAQLRQIRFENICAKAILRPDGELVPSITPFILDNIGRPGGIDSAYVGSTVVINGCQLGSVTAIKVGGVEINDFQVYPDSITFIYPEGLSTGVITLLEGALEKETNNKPLQNLGYITRENGAWSNSSTWLGYLIPPGESLVNIKDTVFAGADITEAFRPGTVIIQKDALLELGENIKVEVGEQLINNGTIITSSESVLDFVEEAVVTNHGNFNATGSGTVNFRNGVTFNGTQPIIFNNLTFNSGIINLPAGNLAATSAAIPVITGNLRLNGGTFRGPNNPGANVGPRYATGSNLIYASGGLYDRGVEWNSNLVANEDFPGFPYNILIENNTELRLLADPNPQPASVGAVVLTLRGNLSIIRGKVTHGMARPLNIRGNVELGIDGSSFSSYVLSNNNESATLNIQGNLIKQVNSSLVFTNTTNRKIIFSGNQHSIISTPGQSVLPDIPNMSFLNLEINKNGGEVLLNCPVGVQNSIHFINGYITTDNDNYLRLDTFANVTGASLISFVNGPLEKVISTASPNLSEGFEFTVGKLMEGDPEYRPVRVADFQHNGATTYSAEYMPSFTGAPPLSVGQFIDPVLSGIWRDEWWEVSKKGDGAARVGLTYYPGKAWVPVAPCATCRVGVAKFDSDADSWQFTKKEAWSTGGNYPEAINNGNIDIVYSDIITSFSPFTIGHYYVIILPVQLLSFSAKLQNSDALLNWEIADGMDLNHFEIEHSTDGRNFKKLSMINPHENNSYEYLHKDPGPGIHYYRLRIVEKDGTQRFSGIELVQIGSEKTIISGLVNNPVQGTEAFVKVYSATGQKAEVIMVDMAGRMVLRQKVMLQKGNNLAGIPISPVIAGQYRLIFRTDDGTEKVMALMK